MANKRRELRQLKKNINDTKKIEAVKKKRAKELAEARINLAISKFKKTDVKDEITACYKSTHQRTGLFDRNVEECFRGVKGGTDRHRIYKILNKVKDVRIYSMLGHFAPAIKNLGFFPWIRPIEEWEPKTKNPHRQFSSLLRHLYALYYVPLFMDKAWFSDNLNHQEWFLHIGQGKNIRTANLPIPFTKRMAHNFLQAPSTCTINEAIRWTQVMTLGGNERIAKGIFSTAIVNNFRHPEFWTSVIRYFIENPMLDIHQYGPIVDWLAHQKTIQPNLTMKGRNADNLVIEVDKWHKELGRIKAEGRKWLPSTTIKPYSSEGKNNSFHIIELLSDAELRVEGKKMSHCVYSYGSSCEKGVASIWSLRKIDNTTKELERLVTISVSPANKAITEIRKKYNKPATESDMFHVRKWINENNLRKGSYL